jgi:thiamine biosynthesis lipoprotein
MTVRTGSILPLLAIAACAPAPPATRALVGEGLGTSWTVKWIGPVPAPEVEGAVVEALAGVDAAMSSWRDDSDLARVRAGTGPVEVRPETALVVEEALELAAWSGGAFDPTVQPLVELWGFHGDRRETLPTPEEIEAARARVGWERVRVGWADGRATVDAGGTALDLSAIAKGHAVDRVAAALSRLGVGSYMVEVGGEVRVSGPGPRGGGWAVGVDRPVVDADPGRDLAVVLEITGAAVATSGNYRNAVVLEGRRFGHIFDPRTGRPVQTPVLSATVVAPDCRTADGPATALVVLGEAGLARMEGLPDVEALVLVADGAGLARRATPGMTALLAPEE